MDITRAATLVAAMTALLLGLLVPALAASEQAGQCAGYDTNTKIDENESPKTVDIEGTMVTVTITGHSVTFTDADDEPISVDFCLKASNNNGGQQSGSAGTVQFLNNGGQTPTISNVVIYRLTQVEQLCPEGTDLAGEPVPPGGIDDCDVPDETPQGEVDAELSGGCVIDDVTFAVSGVADFTDVEDVLLELARDGVVVDSTTLDGSGFASVDDELAAGEAADYTLLVDGAEVDARSFENDCDEVLETPPLEEPPTPSGTARPTDTEVEAATAAATDTTDTDEAEVEVLGETIERPSSVQAGSAGLAASGLPALVLALMALGAVLAGAGARTLVRRR
jgi:hypothetical protein